MIRALILATLAQAEVFTFTPTPAPAPASTLSPVEGPAASPSSGPATIVAPPLPELSPGPGPVSQVGIVGPALSPVSQTGIEGMTEIVLPEPPYGLKALATETGVTLSWTPPSGELPTAYHVYRGEVSGGPYLQVNESPIVGRLSFDDAPLGQPLARGKTYFYVVSAENDAGVIGLNSEELSIVY